MLRPIPPGDLDGLGEAFVPAPEVFEWVHASIIGTTGHLHNPDHEHLKECSIGVLWTSVENIKQGRQVIGQAEIPRPQGNKWVKARQILQIVGWFGIIPEFIITLDANYCRDCTDTEFAALIEHELYHCAQAVDDFGNPAFNRDTGEPKYTLKGHDVEEFVGVVRRYGIGNPEGAIAQLVHAANNGPEVAGINIARACGTCMLRAV